MHKPLGPYSLAHLVRLLFSPEGHDLETHLDSPPWHLHPMWIQDKWDLDKSRQLHTVKHGLVEISLSPDTSLIKHDLRNRWDTRNDVINRWEGSGIGARSRSFIDVMYSS